MRVQEKSSETCAKMTEEISMNGGPDVGGLGPSGSKTSLGIGSADCPHSPSSTATADSDRAVSAGGRLKFFKDGKFILELSHRKEGERTSWIPVPKKTYWPPPGAAGTPRQESSTSLSVSDDNSSVQSSPWQRDHCWKQSSPSHHINKDMAFLMRPSHHVMYIRNLSYYSHAIRRKRRCPYKPIHIAHVDGLDTNNVQIERGHKRTASNPARLTLIVQTLLERVRGSGGGESVACSSVINNVTAVNSCNTSRLDPSIVSPRKRILREMERVSLEDLANSKRQRARPGMTSHSPHANNNGSGMVTCQTQTLPSPPTPKGTVSNYSITSLLGQPDETAAPTPDVEPSFLRTLLKSPPSPTPSPRPRNSVSRRASPSPVPSPPGLRNPVGVPSVSPFLAPPLLYPSPYLPPHSHPYYPPLASPHPSPVWLHYPLSSLPRDAMYSGLVHPPPLPWGPPITHQPMTDKREDTGSDVPLNLSKHAG